MKKVTESQNDTTTKVCACCGQIRPLSHFMRRTGKRSSKGSRRGACRSCRQMKKEQPILPMAVAPTKACQTPELSISQRYLTVDIEGVPQPKRRIKRALPLPPPRADGLDVGMLKPNRHGLVRMRGRTDNGSRWQQEVDYDMAVTLVKEHAAAVVNIHTIRRLYTNRTFRRYILDRDKFTCFFCGEYGDTIDHLLPRAKGGHTTPVNCVCACSLCNQSKAARSLEDFMEESDDL